MEGRGVLYLPDANLLPSLTEQGLLNIPTSERSAPLTESITKELNAQGGRLARALSPPQRVMVMQSLLL